MSLVAFFGGSNLLIFIIDRTLTSVRLQYYTMIGACILTHLFIHTVDLNGLVDVIFMIF